MEVKTAKPTKITKFDKKDDYGNTSYSIEFDNGDKGFYTSKSDNQDKFVIGKDIEYNIESKQGKNGNTYFKLSLPKAEFKPYGGGGGRPPQRDPQEQMISFAMSYTKDLIVGGKVDVKDLEATFERLYKVMTKHIGNGNS